MLPAKASEPPRVPIETLRTLHERGDNELLEQIRELLNGKAAPKNSPRLSKYVEKYFLPHWQRLSRTALRTYVGRWERKIKPEFGNTPLHEISGARIDDWYLTMARTPRSANEARSLLLRFLKRGKRDGHIREVPEVIAKNFKVGRREGLSERQLATLVEHLQWLLKHDPSPHLWAIITMMNIMM